MNEKMHLALKDGTYEQHECKAVERYVGKFDHFVDLGACLGLTSLIAAKKIGAQNVTCVEPDIRLHDVIRGNFLANGLEVPVIRGEAVSTEQGHAELYLGKAAWANSFRKRGPKMRSVTVQTATFSDLVGDKSNVMVVMDIEGAELDVLTCGIPAQVKFLVIETHPKVYASTGFRQIFDSLHKAGFAFQPYGSVGCVLCFERE